MVGWRRAGPGRARRRRIIRRRRRYGSHCWTATALARRGGHPRATRGVHPQLARRARLPIVDLAGWNDLAHRMRRGRMLRRSRVVQQKTAANFEQSDDQRQHHDRDDADL